MGTITEVTADGTGCSGTSLYGKSVRAFYHVRDERAVQRSSADVVKQSVGKASLQTFLARAASTVLGCQRRFSGATLPGGAVSSHLAKEFFFVVRQLGANVRGYKLPACDRLSCCPATSASDPRRLHTRRCSMHRKLRPAGTMLHTICPRTVRLTDITYVRLSRFTCTYSYISNGSQGLSIPPAPQRLKRPMRMASLRKAMGTCSPYRAQKHTPDAMLKGPSYKQQSMAQRAG